MGVASTGVIGIELPRDAACWRGVRAACAALGRRRRRLLRGDPHQRPGPQARLPRGRARRRPRAPGGAGQGRRDDPAALRHDVLLRADRRRAGARDARPAHRRVRQALLRPHLGRRPALHQRHRLRARERRLRRPRRARERRRAARSARRSTRCCASWRSRSWPTARAAGGSGGSSSRAAPSAVEPVARSIANSPLVKTALHGGDPNFGRILQAAGQAWPPGDPFVADLEIEGRQLVSAGDAIGARRRRPARARAARGRRRGRVRADDPRRGRRDRGLLQRPRPRLRPLQLGVHVMRDVATLLEALPYIRDFHGKTVVIKYGGAAMTDPELKRGVRARRGAAQVRRAQPGRGARRRARHHALHGAARHGGEVRRRPARVRRGHRRGGEDGAGRQAEQGHRAAHQPPRAAGGRPVRRRRPAVHGAQAAGRRARPTSASSAQIERVDVDVLLPHRRGLHPGGRVGRRRPRGQLLQRQRGRRRRRPSPRRWAPTR